MPLVDLRLQQFRSYQDSYFDLSSGVTVIAGPNASGKTNLLEAILVVARGGSYRAKDAELVSFGAPWARLDAHTSHTAATGKAAKAGQRTVKLEYAGSATAPLAVEGETAAVKKSFIIEGQNFQRLSHAKTLPVVLFEPNHLQLLSGSPDVRRTYLDDLAEQIEPGFGTIRRQYRRTLAQRNALLKQGPSLVGRQVFVWNVRLSELAGKLVRSRLALLEHINQTASQVYRNISHGPAEVRLEYQSSVGQQSLDHYESALIHRLERNLERDCHLGFTSAGPHRDDIRVLLNNHPVQITASRGESRTLVLMLKILELQLVEQARSLPPLLLLDDVFSELDSSRRHALTSFLQPVQTFITTTDADLVAKDLAGADVIVLS